MSWQTSRERDHAEDQRVEQNHPVHLTCYWSLPSSRGLYRERVMLFTNKSPLKTYYYYAPLHRKLPAINCLFINKSILLTPDSHLERTFPLKYKQMMLFTNKSQSNYASEIQVCL